MKYKTILPFFLMGILCLQAASQTTISGELRFRPELRYGYRNLPDSGSKPVFIVSQRSRLNFSFKKEKLAAAISIQDARIWGDEKSYSATGKQGDLASIDLKEGWLAFNFSKEFTVKAGRQEWKYGDQRLIGTRNWAQTGISYDALLLSYKGSLRIDAGFSYNNDKDLYFQDFYPTDKFKMMNFLYAEKELSGKFELYGLYVMTGMQDPLKAGGLNVKHTIGGSVTFQGDDLMLNGNGYYQAGRNISNVKVSAFLLNGIVSYTIGSLKLTAGSDLLSGNEDSTFTIKDRRFDIFYGARHPFNGEMDFFSNLNNSTLGGGLIDLYFTPELKISDKLNAKAAFHYLRLHKSVLGLGKFLLPEADFKLAYKFNDDLSIDLGYSLAFPTNDFYTIMGSNAENNFPCHWGWVMITYKPVIYKSEK